MRPFLLDGDVLVAPAAGAEIRSAMLYATGPTPGDRAGWWARLPLCWCARARISSAEGGEGGVMLRTTIAGSLPKPPWLATPERLWAPWLLPPETLAEGQRDAVLAALKDQEAAGIDVVTDGEQSRQHFVHGFLETIEGIDFSRRVTIGIRADRYKAEVPTVVGPIRRKGSVHGAEARAARAHAGRKLKFTLPGPMTIVDTIADEHYRSRRDLAFAFAATLNEEARELEAIGVDVIQFDEPAFNVYMREVADWGIAALEAARAGLKCKTAVHICYGYGIKANIDWKETLGSEWRQYEETFPLIAKSSIDQVSLECRNSHVPIELIRLLEGKDVLVGAIDVASNAIETPEEVAETIRAALKFVAPEKLYPCTNCGMAPMNRDIAYGKLAALAAGAHLVRTELGRS
jgi:5-methyltetrahydropteroyltriglutamate--homocysteine methyltransferase